MDLGLNGKVALVAGGGRGSGRAIAEELAREGAKVAITGRDPAVIAQTVAEMAEDGLTALGLAGDMEDRRQVDEWMAELEAKVGGADILVINPPGPVVRNRGFENITDEEFEISTNAWVMPIVHLVRAALPGMKQRCWGRVVNIGSESMKVPHISDPLYSANLRVATVAMLKTLSHEYGRYNVTFNTIATALIMSPLARDYMSDPGSYPEEMMVGRTAMGRWGTPQELAAVAAFLCSERSSWVTGETIRVDGGACHSLL